MDIHLVKEMSDLMGQMISTRKRMTYVEAMDHNVMVMLASTCG